MVKRLCCAFVFALAACAEETPPPAAASPPRLEIAWRIGGFANPESAILSADGAFL